MKPSPKSPRLWTLAAAAGALALMLPAPMAQAQAAPAPGQATAGQAGADVRPAAATSSTLPGVTVEAPPRPEHPVIPPDKKAAFDNEAAKAETWRKYREATPPLSDGTLGQAKGYPGLQSLLPNPEDPGETH